MNKTKKNPKLLALILTGCAAALIAGYIGGRAELSNLQLAGVTAVIVLVTAPWVVRGEVKRRERGRDS